MNEQFDAAKNASALVDLMAATARRWSPCPRATAEPRRIRNRSCYLRRRDEPAASARQRRDSVLQHG